MPTSPTTSRAAGPVLLVVPTRAHVENLRVGDLAIDPFGRLRRVTCIAFRDTDINGRAYVGYYTELGNDGAAISNSMKEGELVRTLATSCAYTAAELDAIEREINEQRVGAPAA